MCGEHGDNTVPRTVREKALYARAQKYVATGILPRTVMGSVWTGPGTGATCSLCSNTIEPTEIELSRYGGTKFRFHVRCHAIWQLAATKAD